MKKILNKQIEKKNHIAFEINTNKKMKICFNKKWEFVSIKNASKKSDYNMKMKNVSKIKKKIIVIITKFDVFSLQKIAENIDSVVFFKIRKFKILFQSELINFWKSIENHDELIKKIKNAKITLILKKLIAYVSAAHKLFTKKLFEKQIIKLSVWNLKINIKKK